MSTVARYRRSARVGAHGQALAEFLVASATLIALFLGTLLLGRYHDLQWSAIQASRYAAFQATVHTNLQPARLEAGTRSRLFEPSPVGLLSADERPDHDRWSRTSTVWADASGRRMVNAPTDINVTVRHAEVPGVAGAAARVGLAALRAAAAGAPGRLDLDPGAFVTASVAVRARDFTLPADAPPETLHMRERMVLLGDEWQASGPAHTTARVAALTLASQVRDLRFLMEPVRWALSLLEPRFGEFCPGRIDPEVVPSDRLIAGRGAERGWWVAPC